MRKFLVCLLGVSLFSIVAQAALDWTPVNGVTPTEKTRPSGVSNGIYYGSDGTSVTLCTYAASKTESAKRVFLVGDMNDWKLSADYQLYKDGNYFWITLTGLQAGKEYRMQYAVERADGVRKQISDLYSEKLVHPDDKNVAYPSAADGGYVTVLQPGKATFAWSDATLNFKRPNKNNLVIYEVWVYDYTQKHTLAQLMKRLDYIQNLGVNAIELMPICEFEGNESWGYNPTHYFAPDKIYGSENNYKTFIDECHKRGIAVILDMVFNHATALNPMNKLYPKTSDNSSTTELRLNPWFNVNVPHDDPQGYAEDWNHDFAPAHEMFTRALQYWLKEYKVDGFRLDLSHGLCGTSYNAVKNLKDYYTNGVKAVSSDAYMILEHWGSSMGTDRPKLVNAGMLCWMNTNSAYLQTAMGWLYADMDGNTDAFSNANTDGYVSYCESHDEERMQYKAKKYGNGNIKTDEAVRVARVPEHVAFNVLLDGSHMLWQFEELGYDWSINSSSLLPDSYDENNRCATKPRPEKYFNDANRVAAVTKCAQVITLRTQLMPTVFEGDPSETNLGSGVALRTIRWGNNVFAAANFAASGNQSLTLPSGVTWYDYLGGGTRASSSYSLAPGELKVFTGSSIAAPTFDDIQTRPTEGFETVIGEKLPRGEKFLQDGQLFIRRGDKVYTITGIEVR